jgi:CelD/BcsL family acetyltransferase involved in cellulose biosynthesis
LTTTIRRVSSEEEFLGLRDAWTELYRTNTNNTPYQTWEWNHTWWSHFGRTGDLRVFLGEQNGQLVGIAPFCMSTRLRGWPIRHLTLISRKQAEYLDLIIRPGAEASFCEALCGHLKEHEKQARFLELKDFRSGSSNFAPLLEAAANTFPVQSIESLEVFVTLPLTATFEGFLATLSKRFAKDVAYYRRSLARNFAVDLKIATDPQAAPGGLEDLIKVYRQRWQEVKGETQFDKQGSREFEQAICRMFAQAGMYRCYVLYVDKEPAAGLLGYVANGKLFAPIFTHSPRFQKYSVGNVLLGMAIEDCIANKWTELDLTRGQEPYKFRWNGQARRTYHLKICQRRADLALASLAEWLYEFGSSLQLAQRARAQLSRLKLRLSGVRNTSGQDGPTGSSGAPAARATREPEEEPVAKSPGAAPKPPAPVGEKAPPAKPAPTAPEVTPAVERHES